MSASLLDTRNFGFTSLAPFNPSRARIWTGRVISGIVIALLTLDTVFKFIAPKEVIQGTMQLGFAPYHVYVIGSLALLCLILYVIPRTSIIGAILWTAYFGGTVATHLRMQNPLFTHILSGVYVSILLWLGLYLRDPRVRVLFAPTR